MKPILECQGLTKKYNNFYALSNLNLTLDRGQIVGLLGPNGSGKTTLIKLINGLLTPTDGRVMINSLAPGAETKKLVSYLPERSYLNDHMRVDDILSYFLDFYDNFDLDRARKMLHDLEIDTHSRLRTLSKGTKDKVQLVLVMSRDAQLYLLDEPIGGVDPATRDYILHTIISNYNPTASVVISTHLIADVEAILDEVIFIQNGQIILQQAVDEIREQRGMSVDALFREEFRCWEN